MLVHPDVAFALADGIARAAEPLAALGLAGTGAGELVDDPWIGPALAAATKSALTAAGAVAAQWRRASEAATMAIAATHLADLGVEPVFPAGAAMTGEW